MRIILSFCLVWILSAPAAKAEKQCALQHVPATAKITEQVQKNDFVTNRTLSEYSKILHADFSARLQKLQPDQHWIDLGAGKAKAQMDYLKSFPQAVNAAQATAVAFKLDRWFAPPKFDGKLSIQEGAFESQPTSTWKKADLMTDVYGVLSYSLDMHTSLQKVFDLLNVGGELYIESSHYRTSFQDGERAVSLMDFLKTIDGLKVEGKFGNLKITKEKPEIRVPGLKLVRYGEKDFPPHRSFQVLP